ncbi:MAG: hypothetical protein ACYCZV_01440 [Acidimicrobiales bacterium]
MKMRVGSPVGLVPMGDVDGTAVAGGRFPTRIWQAFLSASLAGPPTSTPSTTSPP